MSKVLITGITGQDGYYLTKFIKKDYEVHGTIRRSSTFNTSDEDLISEYSNEGRLKLYYSDLLILSLNTLISNIDQ